MTDEPQALKELAQSRLTTPFDYIIIGAGAGGGPLAARLAEAGKNVLLIDAGGDPQKALPSVAFPDSEAGEAHNIPGYHGAATEDAQMSWMFSVRHYDDDEKQAKDKKYNQFCDPNAAKSAVVENKTTDPVMGKFLDPVPPPTTGKRGIFYPRSSGIGGCTAHHAMITVAPNDKDWNYIADLTDDDSWRAEKMRGYFGKIERCQYLDTYSEFLQKLLGVVYRIWRKVILELDPRAVLDGGGHGNEGWLPTAFIDPNLIEQITKEDKQFFQVLMRTALSVVHRNSWLARFLKWEFLRLRVIQALDVNDLNTRQANPEGVFLIPVSIESEQISSNSKPVMTGERKGVRERILETQSRYPDRLIVVTDLHVTRILFDLAGASGAPVAIGIEAAPGKHLYAASPVQQQAPPVERICYFTRGEVIVCGGAFNTPQLLMLSGIGDKGHLSEDSIAVPGLFGADGKLVSPIIHLPGVGKNLQDRYEVSMISELKPPGFSTLQTVSFNPGDAKDAARIKWIEKRTGLYATNGGTLALIRRSSALTDSEREPDIFAFGAPIAFRGYYWNWSRELLKKEMGKGDPQRNLWSWIILKAYTSNDAGTVKLLSNNPFDVPEICFHSFDDLAASENASDLIAIMDTVKVIREINDRIPDFKCEIQPGAGLANESVELQEWIRRQAWGHHASGTCRIGSDSWQADTAKLADKGAVLDSRFKVHGVDKLRVVDASVFPKIPGYFIVTPIYMISEKAADTILADWQDYPGQLQMREAEAVKMRRQAALLNVACDSNQSTNPARATVEHIKPAGNQHRLPPDTIGLALSGGGLRSATFCLGVLQAMSSKNTLRRVDIMSTVSGGGYIGSFLGKLYTSIDDNVADKVAQLQATLADSTSREICWLRENANYLKGAGVSDLQQNLAVFFRNLFSIHLTLALLFMLVFSLLRGLSELELAQPLVHMSVFGIALTGWWGVPIVLLAAYVFPCALGFWLVDDSGTTLPHPLAALLAWLVFLASAVAALELPGGLVWSVLAISILLLTYVYQEAARWQMPPNTSPRRQGILARNRLTRSLGWALIITVASLGLVCIDTFARLAASEVSMKVVLAAFIACGPFLPVIRVVAEKLTKLAAQIKGGGALATPDWIAALIGFPLAVFLVFLVDVVVHRGFNNGWAIGLWLLFSTLAFSLTLGRAFSFLNSSSLNAVYAARLARTFLGAANKERLYGTTSGVPLDVNSAHPKDDVTFDRYHPEINGGPLHLINVCVNETVDLASQRDVRERKGLSMCMGPKGVSVGRRFHAFWDHQPPGGPATPKLIGRKSHPVLRALKTTMAANIEAMTAPKLGLRAIPTGSDPNGFHVLGRRDHQLATVERLRLSQWVAISGAAISTGLGRRTSLPISLLAGLVNIRLGYWWNTGINAGDRPERYPEPLLRKLKAIPSIVFAMQSMLLNEWRAFFEGPSKRLWYLSDGGHFENTATYELFRRRVPLIIAIDGGEDQAYQFSDLALLIRLIRLDFAAEIAWIDPTQAQEGKTGWDAIDEVAGSPIPPWIKDLLNPNAIGRREEIVRNDCPHSVAMGQATYAGSSDISWIILIKASLCGGLPVDLLEYAAQDLAFPNDSTGNQFFDEAQWESYRLLGEYIGKKLFQKT